MVATSLCDGREYAPEHDANPTIARLFAGAAMPVFLDAQTPVCRRGEGTETAFGFEVAACDCLQRLVLIGNLVNGMVTDRFNAYL